MPQIPESRRTRARMIGSIVCAGIFTLAACEEKPTPGTAAGPPAKPASSNAPASGQPSSTSAVSPAALAPGKDAFPSGRATPEGVACDLVRSYITSNSELFKSCCFVITPGSPERDAYNNFLDDTATAMDVDKSSPKPHDDWPRAIVAVYKARPISSAAAATYGAESFRLVSVEFVDIQMTLRGGATETRRTLVGQDEGSNLWTAVPHPELFPQLCVGLTNESPSVEVWKEKTP